MDLEIIDILKEIKAEEYLDLILPNKLSNSLKSIGLSLYDICQLTEDDFTKINGLGKTKYKYLTEFNIKIEENPSVIFLFKKHILNGELIVPQEIKYNFSFAKKIHITLYEFINLVDEKRKLSIKNENLIEKTSFEVFAEYVDLYFSVRNENLFDFYQIAQKYSKSTENIRSNLFYHRSRPDLVDLFLNNEIGYNIKINPFLINEILNFINQNIYKPFNKNLFTNEDDNYSDELIKRFFEIFDHRLEEIEFENSNYIYSTILKKDEKVLFKSHFRVIDLILKTGNKLTYDELYNESIKIIHSFDYNQTNKYIKESGININMFNSILKEYIKLEMIEEDDKQLYQFKWQYLSTIVAKCSRVLFENGGIMSKEEIFEEFQFRENELGIEQSIESLDYLHIKATDRMHPVGKSGNWFYEENYTKEKNSLAKKVNKDIATKFNGKVYLDEFMEYTKSKEFYKNYEISSIRTNILLCSKQAVHDSNIFIHNDFIDDYPEIELKANRNKYLGNSIIKIITKIFDKDESPIEKNQLIEIIISKLSKENIIVKTKSNIYHYLIKFSEQDIIIQNIENNLNYIQLDKIELSKYDLEKIGKKQEPIYKKNIRAKAINYLKDNPKVKLSEVFELVRDFAPAEIAKNNIYRIFNDTSLFIKETIGTDVWISLDTPNLPIPKEMHVEVSEETTEVLGNIPLPTRQLFDTTILKREIINELLAEKNIYGLNQEIIYETFDSFVDITINDQRNSLWGRTLVQSIFENFCSKTDIYDRQICVVYLVTSYETFLKLISPLKDAGRVSGINEIIQSMPVIADLYNYKNQAKYLRDNKQKDNFSYILNKTKYYADLYRHDKTHDDLVMGNSKMMKFIVDFTALYLYTLHLVKRF